MGKTAVFLFKAIIVSGYFLELDTAHSAGIPVRPRAVLPWGASHDCFFNVNCLGLLAQCMAVVHDI